jgi:hypothetical protein
MPSDKSKDKSPKQIVMNVLSSYKPKELWSTLNNSMLPITPQEFSVGALMPAILYMMRWGYRRGKGQFINVFGEAPDAEKSREKAATVSNVAEKIATDTSSFVGFNEEVEKTILSDLLLTYCFENSRHSPGRKKPIQRVFPTHYFSSWIDLPDKVAHLRYVPEMILTILFDRYGDGNLDFVKGKYSINSDFKSNKLLEVFGKGTEIKGQRDNKKSDNFIEETEVSIDQLLAIRIAQMLGEAPLKIKYNEESQLREFLPVSLLASSDFREDFDIFLRAYGNKVPRQSLLPMLESCLSLGLTNIFLSTLKIVLEWKETGKISEKDEQNNYPMFVDCSMSMDRELRRISEEYYDSLLKNLEFLPVCSMCMRVIDIWARLEKLPDYPENKPYPYEKLNFLGKILNNEHEESRDIIKDIRRRCHALAEELKEIEENNVAEVLENDNKNPAWRLAEAIVILMRDKLQFSQYRKFLDSSLMLNEPNGLARKRRVILKGKATDRRSIVLTNTVLDFLVHRHLRKNKEKTPLQDLSLNNFIRILKERYGLYIDESPPGIHISNDHLLRNRKYLEKRLRDLGLLIGVNDAESMKRLRSRFD